MYLIYTGEKVWADSAAVKGTAGIGISSFNTHTHNDLGFVLISIALMEWAKTHQK